MAATTAAAAAFAIPREALAQALTAPSRPADVPTTLQQTLRFTQPIRKQYRRLVKAPGEPYIPRYDVLGRVASSNRTAAQRSLLYLGHYTDIHMIDPQSPARLDVMAGQSASLWAGVIHPQDTLTLNVMTQMTRAMNDARYSPVTGAPMAAAVNTGDSADQHSSKELEWYIGILDGGTFSPNTGGPDYEGPQVWANTFAWHPEDPAGDLFGSYGFPTIPGLLQKAIGQEITSPGLAVPWYSVFGNHDTLINGVIPIDNALRSLAVGGRKADVWPTLANTYLRGMGTDGSVFTQLTDRIWTQLEVNSNMRRVTSDGQRKLFEQMEFIAAHLSSPATPGPVGHGFTQSNLDNLTTYWSADLSKNFRVFGLDTCNQTTGADGAVPQDQFDWLKQGLEQAKQENKMAIVLSHHNSVTLENAAMPVIGGQPLIHAEEFVAMLQQYPNMVAWLNGHTHINTIKAHPKSGGGGFWEITSASCIDFPQQQQLVEFVDNRDGTMSIFVTALDHTSDATWREGDYSVEGLASLSRELAANDWIQNPQMRTGSQLDRNVELLLPAPFDLSSITDADLELEQTQAKARLVAFERRQPK